MRSLHPCHRNNSTNENPWELLAVGKFSLVKWNAGGFSLVFTIKKVSFYINKIPTLFTDTVNSNCKVNHKSESLEFCSEYQKYLKHVVQRA